MKLFMVKVQNNDEIVVQELKILKETEKQIKIDPLKYDRSIINKNEINKLNTQFYIYCICSDIETGILVVKNYYKNRIESLKNEINRKSKIVEKLSKNIWYLNLP